MSSSIPQAALSVVINQTGVVSERSAAAPTGQYAGAAKDRIKALTANKNATNKLQTQGEIKVANDASNAYDEGVKLQTCKAAQETFTSNLFACCSGISTHPRISQSVGG